RIPFQGELNSGEESSDRQGEAHAEVPGPCVQQVLALRAAEGRLPQVRALPDLLPHARAPRRAARYHQVKLVATQAASEPTDHPGAPRARQLNRRGRDQRPPTTPKVRKETAVRKASRP